MKVLWLMNIPMPPQCIRINVPVIPVGGWIEGLIHGMEGSDVELVLCAPEDRITEEVHFEENGIAYVLLPREEDMKPAFKKLLERYEPDLIHVFGTENKHSLDMVDVAPRNKVMLQIQGLVSEYAEKYLVGLPRKFQLSEAKRRRLAKIYKQTSVFSQQIRMMDNGVCEKRALASTKHVLGHTTWDEAWSKHLAPQAEYHCFPEILRKEFYSGRWTYENCRPYSIFLSQVSSPIKGFHILLEALPGIIEDFPETQVYISGFYPRWVEYGARVFKFDYYKYLYQQIKKKGLQEHITFLGVLNAEEMKEQYLLANVFASCSVIENESNSVSEAKILGTPVVSSYVGGVIDRIDHGNDGFFYAYNESNMLRYYIGKIFSDVERANIFSGNAYINQNKLNNPVTATASVLEIYRYVNSL